MTQDEQTIVDIYRKFYEYKLAQNIAGLEGILSNDFHLVHMTGHDQLRTEWLAQVEDGQMRYFSSKEEHINYHVEGNHATLVGQNRVDASIYGNRNTWPLQLTFQFEKVNGKWQATEAVAKTY